MGNTNSFCCVHKAECRFPPSLPAFDLKKGRGHTVLEPRNVPGRKGCGRNGGNTEVKEVTSLRKHVRNLSQVVVRMSSERALDDIRP